MSTWESDKMQMLERPRFLAERIAERQARASAISGDFTCVSRLASWCSVWPVEDCRAHPHPATEIDPFHAASENKRRLSAGWVSLMNADDDELCASRHSLASLIALLRTAVCSRSEQPILKDQVVSISLENSAYHTSKSSGPWSPLAPFLSFTSNCPQSRFTEWSQ